ncbi:MAG: protein-L-isoaspartate O-methyltransferase family protein [Hyphomicrobiaceae bacterium]
MVDPERQRLNMVESQVRPSDVTDRRVLAAMTNTPREAFVPAPLRSLAYMDDGIALTTGKNGQKPVRAMMAPRVLAKLLQALDLTETDVVLDIGCATGYSTAILAAIAETVVALEADPEWTEQASENLSSLGLDNTAVVTGVLKDGYASEGPYDAIFLGGTVAMVPEDLLDQLKDGGRLVTVVAEGPLSRAVIWRRSGEIFDREDAFEASAPELPGFERKAEFTF